MLIHSKNLRQYLSYFIINIEVFIHVVKQESNKSYQYK